MADDSFQEKTEEATPKKREKTREEGQVAKSMEISSVFVLLAGVLILYALGSFSYDRLIAILRESFMFERIPNFDIQYCLALFDTFAVQFFIFIVPIFFTIFVVALVVNFMQVGFVLSHKAIAPKLEKLDPIKGLGRLFSIKSIVEAIKATLKICIIGLVAYFVVKGETARTSGLYGLEVLEIFVYMFKIAFKIFIWTIVVMVVVAILDYLYQRWQFEQQIKMTKQEIKDEFKQAEGDPQVKGRIKSLQQQAAKKRMMQEVPEADVVVTNPTHFAVAIKYKATEMSAPHVVAKGAGPIAQRIKAVALENDVPVVENKELAQNLYKLVDIGDEVPAQFFKAVAEILAYVYRLKGKSVG